MQIKPAVLAVAIALAIAVGGCADRTSTRADAAHAPEPPAESTAIADRRMQQAEVRARIVGNQAALANAQRTDAAPAPGAVAPAIAALPPPAPPAPIGGLSTAAGAWPNAANTERYATRSENPLQRVADDPVSTFSIDVDTGSYSNVRRMLASGVLPPADAVRTEEFLNYFDHGYAPPRDRATPFSVTTELAPAPWDANRTLLLVGIKGYEVPREAIPAVNLVFLIDTSGSMQDPAKLPLLVDAFKQLVPRLRAIDSVSIVAYAGSAGLVLAPTRGDQHERITAALDGLSAGGSTAGGAGIELAYATAREAFIDGGVNRVILATDGDFNVGTVDTEALKSLVAERRRSGIALSTLGFGAGNYNDDLSEQLADVGNGNHAYIDDAREARKVLVDEMSSTLMTIASDVKVQLEFNPATVAEYRLIGYENRVLRREDFNNDRVDAGEIGAGHDVTALYELTLANAPARATDPLRYARPPAPTAGAATELAFLKLRYKRPGEDRSVLLQHPIGRDAVRAGASPRLAFAASVAAFADHLRGGTHMGDFDLDAVARLAQASVGDDPGGQRGEFVDLVRGAQSLRTPEPPRTAAIAD